MDGSKFFPRRLSFPKICEVLVAYLNAGADKEYVGINDVAKKTSVSLHNISRNNNFFKSWGFLEESEREQGKYILNREAAEFAYVYRIDPKGREPREILRRFLSKDEVLVKFVERIEREGLNRESALLELPRIYGDLRADKVGLNAFLDMLIYAFGLEEISAPKEAPREAGRSIRVVKPITHVSKIAVSPETRLTININVTPEVSPQQLKEYVRAILEALHSTKVDDASNAGD